MRTAELVATSGYLAGRRFPVGRRLSLGRAAENDLQLPRPQVSRAHAVIEQRGREFTLTDLGSRNGTRVNGQLVECCVLRNGDQVVIDEFGFDFVMEESPGGGGELPARVVHFPEGEHTVTAEVAVSSAQPQAFSQPDTSGEGQEPYRKAYGVLVKAGEAFGMQHDLSSLFGKILEHIFELVPAHRGVIFVSDEQSEDFQPVAHKLRGSSQDRAIEVSRTLLRRAADEKKAILTTNARADARFRSSESIPLQDIRSAMCSPMLHDGELVGIIYLDTVGAVGEFDARGLELLAAISGPAAIAVENARYVTELALRSRQLEKSYYDTLKVVVHSLEMRDYYTIGHGRRVAVFARATAEEMGWDEERLRVVEMGGILHDVGKIGIEDAILRKQARLDDTEVEQMQFHPEIGARIVRDADFLKPLVPFILYHQERYDGSGHPYRLKGDEIPIEGRLLGVADAFDAMTSDRPYRKAMPAEEAIGVIREERGKQFDPEVVDAFLRAWDKGKITGAMLASAEKVKVVECPCCSSKMTIDPRSTNPFLIHCPECHKRANL